MPVSKTHVGESDYNALKVRSALGGAYTFASRGGSLAVQILATIVLARLVSPEDFGLVAMVTAITGFALIFKDLGLSTAAIQAPSLSRSQSSNLFWCNTVLGLVLTLILIVASPIIALVYHDRRLIPITCGLSSCFLISALSIQHQALLRRELEFGKLALVEFGSIVCGSLLGFGLAWFGASYWALVGMQIARAAFNALQTFLAYPWRPAAFQRNQGTWSMVRFGSHLVAFDAVNYLSRNLDKVLIGRFAGAETVGFYGKAYELLLFPVAQVRAPIVGIALPILSKLQDQPREYASYFTAICSLVATLSIPLIAWMAVAARSLILFFLGKPWLPAVDYFQILAIAGLFQPTVGILGVLLVSSGRSRRYFFWGLWHSSLMVSAFVIGAFWGAKGVAVAYAVANILVVIPSVLFCVAGSPVRAHAILGTLLSPVAFSVLAGLTCRWLIARLSFGDGVLVLAASALVFLVIYVVQFALIPSRNAELRRWIGLAKLMISRGAHRLEPQAR